MRYLLVRAAGYSLLVEASLVASVTPQDAHPDAPHDILGAISGAPDNARDPGVDLAQALGGEPAAVVIRLTALARVTQVGVDACNGLVEIEEDGLAPLPPALLAAVGSDVDAVTRKPLGGAQAFRLRLARPTR